MLIPTASMNIPSAVLRVKSQNTTSVTNATITGVGKNRKLPLPIHARLGELKVTI